MEQKIKMTEQNAKWKYKARLPYCQIWQNKALHIVAQAYPIKYFQLFAHRVKCNSIYVVSALGTIFDQVQSKTYLLIERIPNRLSEVSNLNEQQSLKVLFSAFKGLEYLQSLYSHFSINDSCVCFNEYGKVKIWINPDLGSVQTFKMQKQSMHKNNRTLQNIYYLTSIVERKSFNGYLLRNLLKKIKENLILSYKQASQEILKIGEMLYINVEDKPYGNNCRQGQLEQKSFMFQVNNSQNVPERDIVQPSNNYSNKGNNCNIKIGGHQRKYSHHNERSKDLQYKYIQNLQPLEKLSEDQRYFKLTYNHDQNQNFVHKSAPLSPREGSQKRWEFLNQTQAIQFHLNRQSQLSKTQKFTKKPEIQTLQCTKIKKGFYELQQSNDTLPIKIDQSQQIVNGGNFHTFGILEDSFDRLMANSKKKLLQNNQSMVKLDEKSSEFNISLMDKEIQKKLSNKLKKKQRISITDSINKENIQSKAFDGYQRQQFIIYNKQNLLTSKARNTGSTFLDGRKKSSFSMFECADLNQFTNGKRRINLEGSSLSPKAINSQPKYQYDNGGRGLNKSSLQTTHSSPQQSQVGYSKPSKQRMKTER